MDPNPVGCRFLQNFEDQQIPIYSDLETFYANSGADLVIIAAPIHLHTPFTITALDHGSNVLCEKPIAATIQETPEMLHAESENRGVVGIGYQWSYAPAMRRLKQDIMDGFLGNPNDFGPKYYGPEHPHITSVILGRTNKNRFWCMGTG